MTTICVFGDSIAYGAWDEKGGWAQRLRAFLEYKIYEVEKKFKADFIFYNLGVSGNTTKDLLKRFEFETKQRVDETEKDLIFIFEIGKNDPAFKISPEKFKENLQKLINKAKKYSQKIIFVGLAFVDESKTNPCHWDSKLFYLNKTIKEYNQIIEQICKKNNLHFIEILNLLDKKDFEDGLHPNEKGHEKIFQKVKDVLK